jgi:hypothetical protein
MLVGENAAILFGKETTPGTAATRTAHLPLISTGLKAVDTPLPRQHLRRATGGLPLGYYRSRRDVGGPVRVEMYYSGSGLVWLAAMGSVATSGSGPYTHTYKLEDELVTLSSEVHRGDGRHGVTEQAELFLGSVINRLNAQVDAGGFLTADLDVLAQQANDRGAGTSVVLTDGNLVRADELGTLSWNGLTLALRSVGVEIDNGHTFRPRLGARTSARMTRTNPRMVKLRATLDQVNDDLYQAFQDGDVGDAVITFTGQGNEEMTWTLHNARLGAADGPIQGAGIISETIELLPAGDGSDRGFEVVIVNDVASGES